ncbi:PQQ-binding-like beta-propeller repeat protein [Luteolibacter arcticus]|uniref:PQQ-binding-like beta-propeller repeat protein n=1 Tax=Luteolibacter arcticus TaxID=1581411 RepID=A0ABT3GGR6_9BACT|nr:LamG-like jellyroll fold domain-containing protein [Luteolibacter arcticus]MCW1922656.1 PQQ-binding-like beta-propeller repeat protein [Luteolibacter arcticus]
MSHGRLLSFSVIPKAILALGVVGGAEAQTFINRPTATTSEWRFDSRNASGVISKVFGPGTMTEIGLTGHKGVFSVANGTGTPELPGAIDGRPVPVMYFDGATKSGEGWRMNAGTGVTDHYEYTLVYDLFVPASNTAGKLALYQGNPGNSNDADYFLMPSSTGIFRSPNTPNSGQWTKGQWQRVVVAADYTRNSDKVFINGDLKSTQPRGDWAYGTQDNWILSDNGSASYVGDHSKGYVAAFAFVPRLLTDTEIAILGDVTPGGIFEVSDGFPAGLASAPDTGAGTITLNWRAADNRSNAAGVELLRNATVIAQLPLDAATFTDTPPVPTTSPVTYSYRVRAYGGSYTGGHADTETTVNWALPSLTTGLTAYYPFENDFKNLSGNPQVVDAVPYGPPTFIADGRRGRALRFHDTASPIQKLTSDLGATEPFAANADFTVSIWYRHMGAFTNRSAYGGSTADPMLIGNKNWASGANLGWGLVCGSDGSVKWNYKGSSGSRLDAALSSKENADGTWHHVLVVHDRDGRASFYVDGAKLASEPVMAGQGSVETGSPVVIGADSQGAYRYSGDLDEVALWTRSLTAEEAAMVYQRGRENISVTGSNFADADLDGLPDGWEISYFGNLDQTAESDFDKDGIAHLLEFAQGMNPTVAAQPQDSRVEIIPDPVHPGQKVAAFRFKRPRGTTDLQYLPECSPTLKGDTWRSGDAVLPRAGMAVALPDGRDELTVYSPQNVATAPTTFFRLRVNRVYQGAWTPTSLPQLDYTANGPVIRWVTDTPTATIVDYGTGTNITRRYEDFTLTTQHEVVLSDIPAGTDLSFSVVHLQNGLESSSETYTGSGKYDLRPPRVPDQGGFATGGSHAADAQALLASFGASGKGWCLDIGSGDGKFAYEIVRQSELMVVGVESDPAKVAAAEQFLSERGVLGSRVTIVQVPDYTLGSIPFRPNTFNLITDSGSFSGGGVSDLAPYSALMKPGRGKSIAGPAAALAVTSKPRPASYGSWTHLYGNSSNTTYSGEELANVTNPGGASSTGQTEVQWIGRPGGEFTIDRQLRQSSPLAANGRFYTLGDQRVIALDSQNGAVLWSKLIPNLARFNVIRDCSNLVADDEGLFAATGGECWRIDGDSGTHSVLKVSPGARSDLTWHWGLLYREGSHLIGSAVSSTATYRKWWGPQYWYDSRSGSDTRIVCADNLFSRDPVTGSENWVYEGGLILHPTVTMGNGRIYFLESRNPTVLDGADRNLPMASLAASNDLWMVALDLTTGQKVWEKQPVITGGTPCIYGSYSSGVYLVTAANAANSRYYLHAFDSSDGTVKWAANHAWLRGDHAGHQQHPVVLGGSVYLEPKIYNLQSGVASAVTMPSRNACSTFIAVKNALIFRGDQTQHYGLSGTFYGGNISMWNISSNTKSLWNRMRPSCWISTIAADGCVLVQDGAAGCSCGPWLEVTCALSPL